MPKVLCTLPNASDEISGVKFSAAAGGVVSEDIAQDVADGFLAIPGYELVSDKVPAAPESDATKASEAEKADLLTRAAAIEFKVKANWSLDRLRSEVESAEKAAAEVKAPADTEAAAEGKTE